MPIFLVLLFSLVQGCQSTKHIEKNNRALIQKSCPRERDSWQSLNHSNVYQYDKRQETQWISRLKRPRGVIIILHGLNLRPNKMDPIALELAKQKNSVLRGTLKGHHGDINEHYNITFADWSNDVHHLICLGKKEAQEKNVPLYFLGHSTGALATLSYINQSDKNPFTSLFLIAPAHKTKWYTSLPGKLSFLGKELSLPSKNLKEYRDQKSTSLAMYKAINHGQLLLEGNVSKSLNKKTIVYMDPKDEVIDLKGQQEFIEKNQLTEWKINLASNKEHLLPKSYHHLIIDQQTLGPREWTRLIALLNKHFQKNF